MRTALLLFTFFSSLSLSNDSPALFPTKERYPIYENGFWGYIDMNGNVVIPPRFRNAGYFSEGLAPVRLNGTYGYIDLDGKFAIQPQFDAAYDFRNGIALVFEDGRPFFINTAGARLFEHSYVELSPFDQDGRSIVKTASEKFGVIDLNGKLVVDTIFQSMTPFEHGRSIVKSLQHTEIKPSIKERITEIGMIDTDGNMIVPYGKCDYIGPVSEGFCYAMLHPKTSGAKGENAILDIDGNTRFVLPDDNLSFFDHTDDICHEGKGILKMYIANPNTIKRWSSKKQTSYKAVIDMDGNVLFGEKDWADITPFKHDRAFYKDTMQNWYLIDEKGKRVTETAFKDINYHGYSDEYARFFDQGIALVQTDQGWTAIDRNGRFLAPPGSIPGLDRNASQFGEFFILRKENKGYNGDYEIAYGYWNTRTGTLVVPQYEFIYTSDLRDKLLLVREGGRTHYVDHEGLYYWSESKLPQGKPQALNIDFMMRGYCYAYSSLAMGKSGGWATSHNLDKVIDEANRHRKVRDAELKIHPDKPANFDASTKGMKMTLSNYGVDTLIMSAQDSRLYLNLQALNKKGEWQNIEYLPSSWCGNSYHIMELAPNHYWEFIVPEYTGEFKTLIRAQLLIHSQGDGTRRTLYSAPIKASVNPGQFWKKPDYRPSGIMDPYLD